MNTKICNTNCIYLQRQSLLRIYILHILLCTLCTFVAKHIVYLYLVHIVYLLKNTLCICCKPIVYLLQTYCVFVSCAHCVFVAKHIVHLLQCTFCICYTFTFMYTPVILAFPITWKSPSLQLGNNQYSKSIYFQYLILHTYMKYI